MMSQRLNTARTTANLATYIRTYFLFKRKRLPINVKLTLYKAPIRSVVVYACPTWDYVAELYGLQNRVLCATGCFDRRTPVREMHMAFKIPSRAITYQNYAGNRLKSSKVIYIQMSVQSDKEKPCRGSIRGLNLAVVKPTTVQVTNCRIWVVNEVNRNLLQKPALAEVLCTCCIILIHHSKWQSVYDVHKAQMPLLGRCVSAGTPVRNYGATNVAPTQKDRPLLTSKTSPHFQTNKRSWNKYILGHGSRRGAKPRTTVLARATSNSMDSTSSLNNCQL
jgi:hypothetical protein